MSTITNNKIDNQSKLLAEVPEVQDISNESAASIQGGAAKLYDWKNGWKSGASWLGTFNNGKSKFSKRANDDVSSVHITYGIWAFYEHSYYNKFRRGDELILGPGKYNLKDYDFDQKMSSLRRIY